MKHRILREQTEQKFLLYRDGPEPTELENWLLDVQLAHTEFRTTQVAMWLAELDLGPTFAEVVGAHAEFFGSGKRKEALKRLLKSEDSAFKDLLSYACRLCRHRASTGCDSRSVARRTGGRGEERAKLITRCALGDFLEADVAGLWL